MHCRMKNKIGLVTEQNPFFTERSIIQNAELMGRFYEEWDMELFKEQIDRMELPGYRTVGKLSRGEFFRLLQEVIADEKASILMTSHIEKEMHRPGEHRQQWHAGSNETQGTRHCMRKTDIAIRKTQNIGILGEIK